jgi:hypothetical protein
MRGLRVLHLFLNFYPAPRRHRQNKNLKMRILEGSTSCLSLALAVSRKTPPSQE